VVTHDAPSHPPPDSNVLQLQRDGSGSSRFHLVGNVTHTGETLNSGHYYADVRCNDRWIRVNDTSVQSIEWDHCQLQSPPWSHLAYVQMYSRPVVASVRENLVRGCFKPTTLLLLQ
jgi:ubiquitin C-terminal hydrolase